MEFPFPDTAPSPDPEIAGEEPVTDPNLSRSIRNDYEAIMNDLEQAHALASDFQHELRGKSNEVAHLKQVLRKTDENLSHLNESIASLREERHRLANEVMIARGAELKIKRVTEERDRLLAELESTRKRTGGLEAALKSALQVSKTAGDPAPSAPASHPHVRAAASAVSVAVQRLLEMVDRPTAGPASRPPEPPKPAPRPAVFQRAEPEEIIDISFSA